MIRRNLLLFLCICATTLASAQNNNLKEDMKSIIEFNPDVSTGTLDNGLQYYIKANKKPENRAELRLVVKAGSTNEDEDQKGLAHFCEHMSFNGTKNFPKHELIKYFESIGMEFGPEINAYTSFDETVYMLKIPLDNSEYMTSGLQVLYDWACQNTDSDEEINNERGVITEEWRSGKSANERMMKEWLPVLLKNSIYAERLPIGDIDIIKEGDPQRLRDFRNDWYRPDLQAIIVVGDFNKDEIEKSIIDKFSKIPTHSNPREDIEPSIPSNREPLAIVTKDKEANYTTATLYIKHDQNENTLTEGAYYRSTVDGLYNTMLQNRFNEILQKENQPFLYASSSYSNFIGKKDTYSAMVVSHPGKLIEGFKAMLIENERVKRFGFTPSELERAKINSKASYEKMYNERSNRTSISHVEEFTRHFLKSESVPGTAKEYELFNKYIDSITVEDINSRLEEWFTDENRVIIATGPDSDSSNLPSEDQLIACLSEVDKMDNIEPYSEEIISKSIMKNEPKSGSVVDSKKIEDIDATELTLSNGIKVIIKSTDNKSDEIIMNSFSSGGKSLYNNELSAEYAASIMNISGISDFDNITLGKMLAGKVASASPYISRLWEGVNGSSNITDFETMLQLTNLYFTAPRMDESAFNANIEKMRSSLATRNNSPNAIFSDSITSITYNYHPLTMPLTVDRLKELDFNRMEEIVADRFKDASEYTFVFVGNIDLERDQAAIEKYIGSLPTSDREENWIDPQINFQPKIVDKNIYKGENEKCTKVILFKKNGEYDIKGSLATKAAIKVLETRLLEKIREEKGLVYSIGASYSVERIPETEHSFTVSFGCNPANADTIQIAVFNEINSIIKSGISEKELSTAVEKIKRERELSIKNNNFWMGSIVNHYKMGEDSYMNIEEFNSLLGTITVKDIKREFKKSIDRKNYVSLALMPESFK